MGQGMVASAWLRILIRNRFAVSPTRIPLALQVSLHSVVNSFVACFEQLLFSKRIAASAVNRRPIFIIGHWRTGTSFLHELMAIDRRFTSPTTLECFVPAHFLLSRSTVRHLSFLLPATRPMDDMRVSWESPQEDEIALTNLGARSPYETILFPNHRPIGREFLNMTESSPSQLEAWKRSLSRFLQRVNFRSELEGRIEAGTPRLILKSPPHTARLKILREMFPAAQFIHMVRHPSEIFVSTLRLWRGLWETQGLQKPRLGRLPGGGPSVEEFVLDNMGLLYRDFFAQAAEIPQRQFCEIRYEDLVRSPVREMQRIYHDLDLGPLDPLLPQLNAHLCNVKNYQPNAHRISEADEAEVWRRWDWYGERYGYQRGESVAVREARAE
jgi:omega-hydroxy-beta-dihydromenaquinone-9 sulfotransferase